MTLKDEFEMTMISFLIEKKQDATMLDHFQKIADDYAIEFADYINRNSYRSFNGGWYLTHIKKTTEEMLEIFKKEKGL
jgi:hypothetical protein